jgi:LuxR family transcriptional regulator, quorum-sensing system regulator CviR
MKIKYLSKHDMIILLEMIHDSLACCSEDEIRNVMSRLNTLIPHQASLSCISEINGKGAIESMQVVNVDYPAEYLVELGKRGLVVKDPIVIENFKSFKLQYWADTFKRQGEFSDVMNEIGSLAEDFGFHKVRAGCGYGHGVSNLKRTEGSFFCYQGMERSTRTEEILELVIPHFHEALRRVSSSSKNGSSLTSKETEILKWIKQGKTTWDISTILGISERTVKFHVANILQKLDATTRAHAVAIALEQKLIDIE